MHGQVSRNTTEKSADHQASQMAPDSGRVDENQPSNNEKKEETQSTEVDQDDPGKSKTTKLRAVRKYDLLAQAINAVVDLPLCLSESAADDILSETPVIEGQQEKPVDTVNSATDSQSIEDELRRQGLENEPIASNQEGQQQVGSSTMSHISSVVQAAALNSIGNVKQVTS